MSSWTFNYVDDSTIKKIEEEFDFIKEQVINCMKRGERITIHNIPHTSRFTDMHGVYHTSDIRLDGYTYAISVGEYPKEVK